MYAIFTSPGFIISSQPYGEAGKLVNIFTRDFGLVNAIAQGIRLEKSKLRYASQDYSLGTYSLVRGKEFWRLTDAVLEDGQTIQTEFAARLSLLLKRLLHGEEAHSELYDCFIKSIQFAADTDTKLLPALESLSVARMLYLLGYIGKNGKLDEIIRSADLNNHILESLFPKRIELNKLINQALKESHL